MKLTKEYIKSIKEGGESSIVKLISNYENDNAKVNFILENLGALPNNFSSGWLFGLTKHDNHKIRMSAVKNIGKLKLNGEIKDLLALLDKEKRTEIRREIVSSIGRQRNEQVQSFLIQVLKDNDPKVVCQAVRALLAFKSNPKITKELKKLKHHKNEMVSAVIEKEFFTAKEPKSKLHHTQTYDFLKNTVVHGNVKEVIKSVPSDSVHLTFTSPPYYNARDYSIYPSYQDYLHFLDNVFKDVHRVTKEGRFLLINTSPIIISRISRQHSSRRYPIPFDLHHYVVKNEWEYIDDIVWVKPEASVKNRVGGFQQHRKPLGYKPNTVTEMIMVYRKKTTKLIDWNIRQYSKEIVDKSKVLGSFETSNIWKIDPTYNKNHSAVFPAELCKKVLQYYSFEGDLVFDPFGGSGTFGRTAKASRRFFFLTEIDDGYFEYMKVSQKTNFFEERETQFLTQSEFKRIANDPHR